MGGHANRACMYIHVLTLYDCINVHKTLIFNCMMVDVNKGSDTPRFDVRYSEFTWIRGGSWQIPNNDTKLLFIQHVMRFIKVSQFYMYMGIPGFCIPYLNWIPNYSVQYSNRDGRLGCKASLVTYI